MKQVEILVVPANPLIKTEYAKGIRVEVGYEGEFKDLNVGDLSSQLFVEVVEKVKNDYSVQECSIESSLQAFLPLESGKTLSYYGISKPDQICVKVQLSAHNLLERAGAGVAEVLASKQFGDFANDAYSYLYEPRPAQIPDGNGGATPVTEQSRFTSFVTSAAQIPNQISDTITMRAQDAYYWAFGRTAVASMHADGTAEAEAMSSRFDNAVDSTKQVVMQIQQQVVQGVGKIFEKNQAANNRAWH